MSSWQFLITGSCLALVLAASLAAPLSAEETAQRVSYYQQVRPILQAHCQGCHQPAKAGGEYVMTSYDSLLAGGESGTEAIAPGSVGESYLIELITPTDGAAEMPKGKRPLSESDRELIARWIAQGAEDDTPASATARYDQDHPPSYQAPPVVTALDFSPQGDLLAVSGYHEVLLHKGDGSELVARLVGMSERIESLKFSPDGKWLVVTGGLPARMGEVQLWDVAERRLKLSIPLTYDTIYGANWSPDGKLISFGCSDNTTRAIDAETGEQVLYSGSANDWVLDTVFSTDGSHLIAVGRDMTAKLIEVSTQRFVDNITSITPGALKGGISSVDRHPTKDEILVGSADGVPKTYRIHRTQARMIGDDHQKIRHFDALPGRVFSVQYSPSGEHILAGSSYNGKGEVRVYETESGKLVWKYQTTPVYAVTYRSDGKQVAAAGFDGTVRLLDAVQGTVQHEFVPVPLNKELNQKEPVAVRSAQPAQP